MSICAAIQSYRLIAFTYDGYPRVVEPHVYGTDKKGHSALRAYQVRGGSESGEFVGWKLFHADEIHGLVVLGDSFAKARPGYKRGDKAFTIIRCQL